MGRSPQGDRIAGRFFCQAQLKLWAAPLGVAPACCTPYWYRVASSFLSPSRPPGSGQQGLRILQFTFAIPAVGLVAALIAGVASEAIAEPKAKQTGAAAAQQAQPLSKLPQIPKPGKPSADEVAYREKLDKIVAPSPTHPSAPKTVRRSKTRSAPSPRRTRPRRIRSCRRSRIRRGESSSRGTNSGQASAHPPSIWPFSKRTRPGPSVRP